MLCENCSKNAATVRYAEVVDGKVSERHLCPQCMAKLEQKAEKGFELSGPTHAHRPVTGFQFIRDKAALQRICSSCATKFIEVCQTGMLGCPMCYETFAEQLEPLLGGMHIGLIHHGKAPRVDDDRARIRAELQTKRSLLRSSLRTENYEEAAMLRDEIKALEGVLGWSGVRSE